MPELPEVETIKRGLEHFLIGKHITKVTVKTAKSFTGKSEEVVGHKVIEFKRRGKALLIGLDGNLWLMIHLRMTGQLIYIGEEKFAAGHPDKSFVEKMPGRHTRVIFEFDDASHLYFNDQRKFGFVKFVSKAELEKDPFLTKLAPEPWELTPEEFFARLQRRKGTTIKAAILDQSVIAGVGNIYADESLFFAQIFPGRKVADVSRAESGKLLKGIREVMEASIASGGSTMKDYVRADGTKGNYLEKFAKVFQHDGQKCLTCSNIILKTKIAGRGTHYCPECQK
ncbi:MAG: bifunctional DNA-formamidopyrimidine glycosylase/DNA-(apurinic or apyrimidinic site) lyase [Candidatus Nomurabacteria bacterium]|jgi:formamidopyrimidine-DNA glycosylase|nr:bifunctional DNA-formamidopyrimidine glycosylase/DNA-(apurinic or apyrimidinic site) lyase [Candidatus Nomurabacteria bacterium]